MLQHILLGFGISFVGSLPLGVLNLTAIEVAVNHRFRQVLLFALGVVLVEYGQAYIAIRFSTYMMSNPGIERAMELLVIPLFGIIGLLYLLSGYRERKAAKQPATHRKPAAANVPPFHKGILLSIINPLAVPYWLAVCTSLAAAGSFDADGAYVHPFIWGVAGGTFLALVLYGSVGEVLEKRLKRYERYFNTVIGLVFLVLAAMQACRLFL